ncbi:uncharacterized protein EDB91DRAFT_1087899 [Suillus paluster]|uniref:uncharacterized protein n=1 Tax=Suillus paluster TaxID=48578 RepID=UPI001B861995|nr:uncharacterized protein EDB91DRAFT_1087899 [Suillus paluster]KAG1723191.1 hypothetical protein EDB91DRAFT_1087899 [Suillus paluster]
MENWQEPESPSDDQFIWSPGDNEPADSESHSRELRLIVRLGQPFSALLLAQQRGGEYKRIASDNNIIAHVKDMASVRDMMEVKTLEILPTIIQLKNSCGGAEVLFAPPQSLVI